MIAPHTPLPKAIASRPASHTAASTISGLPSGVSSPVQLRPAVNRKPMMTAIAKPKIISCACHQMPGIGNSMAPE